MNGSGTFAVLAAEAQQLYALLSPGHILLLLALYVLAVLMGRTVRMGVYVIWRLGVDPERRLAPLGTVIQVGLCFMVTFAAFREMVAVAPLATFVHVVVVSPVLLWLFSEATINALAGLSILFRRSLAEGDHIVLESGHTGQVRQIRLTTTVARTEEGGRILIPNRRLLHGVTAVGRRQAGVRLVLRFPVDEYASEALIARVRTVLLLSPYRAAGSQVSAEYDRQRREIEASLRIPRTAAQDAARRELSLKILPLLTAPSAEVP